MVQSLSGFPHKRQNCRVSGQLVSGLLWLCISCQTCRFGRVMAFCYIVANKFFLLPSDWPFTIHTHSLNPDLLTFAAKHYSELCLIPEPQTIWQHVSKRVSFLWNVVPSSFKFTGSESKISANQFANELRITRHYWTVLSGSRIRLNFNKTTQTNISKNRIAPATDWWVEGIIMMTRAKYGSIYFDLKPFNLEE